MSVRVLKPEGRGGGAAERCVAAHVAGGPFALLAQARAELGRGQEWRPRMGTPVWVRRFWPERGPPTAPPGGGPLYPC